MYQLVCYLVRRVRGRCIKVFRFKIFFCGFCFYSGRKSPSDERAAKDPSQNAEETFLFGSSSISSLSVAGTSLTSSPFGQKASTSSPGLAGPSSLVFATNATGDHDESAPNSGVPVTFNSFGQGGNASEQRVRGNKVSFSQSPSYGAGISFGSPKSSQSDTKPIYSFGSISQTPNLSSGVPGSFVSFGQKGNANEKTVETKKVSFNQSPWYGGGFSFGSAKTSQSDTKPTCSFGSISQTPNLSSGVPGSFGSFGQKGNASEKTVETQKVSFNQSPSHGGRFSFGSAKTSRSDTKPTYSFGLISQTPNFSSGVPGSFGSFGQGENVSEQKVEKKIPFSSAFTSTDAGPFSSAMQSAERGYCFRSTTSTAGAGFSFAPTTSTAGAGVFGSTTSTVRTGGLFVSTSAQSTHPMFSFPLTMPSTSSS